MNICMIAKYLPVHITGGMETHVWDLANELVKRNQKVTILTAPHPKGIKKEEKEDLKIRYLDKEPRYFRRGFYKSSAEELKKKDKNFDLVHSQSTLGAGYLKYCEKKKPFVVTSHGTPLNEIKTVLSGRRALKSLFAVPFWTYRHLFVDPQVYEKANRIISPSYQLKDDIVSQFGIEKNKIDVILNGIDIQKFSPRATSEELKKSLNIQKGEKVLLSVGRITEGKGFDNLIKIISKIKNVELIIIGEGPKLEDLHNIAENERVTKKVNFLGEIAHEKLPAFYNLADVFCFPSKLREACPLVLIEAMACGVPVVASRIGGIPNIVENYKDGLLVEPGSITDIEKKIRKLVNDDSLRKRLGEKAREKAVNQFSIEQMVKETIQIYKEIKNV